MYWLNVSLFPDDNISDMIFSILSLYPSQRLHLRLVLGTLCLLYNYYRIVTERQLYVGA